MSGSEYFNLDFKKCTVVNILMRTPHSKLRGINRKGALNRREARFGESHPLRLKFYSISLIGSSHRYACLHKIYSLMMRCITMNKLTNILNLDIKTFIFTAILIPSFYYLISITKKHIKYSTQYVIDIIIYYFGRIFKPSLLGHLTLKRYCRIRLSEENRYLYVPSSLDIKLEIDKVFVSLNLDNQGTEKSGYSHVDILTAGNRIRVMGDPGSGKSSLIKRLFRDTCSSALDKPSKSKLPISPFAQSISNILHYKLPGQRSPPPQPLQDVFLQP